MSGIEDEPYSSLILAASNYRSAKHEDAGGALNELLMQVGLFVRKMRKESALYKTRAEAVALIHEQLRHPYDGSQKTKGGRVKGQQCHYGVQELRDLMDEIYGGRPEDKNEEIVNVNK